MVRKYHLVGAAAAVLFAGAGLARAGMINTTQVQFSGDSTIVCDQPNYEYYNTYHELTWWVDGAGAGQMTMNDNEHFITPDTHTYTQTVDGDPLATISTTLFNFSGVDWIEYDVSIASLTAGVTVTFTGTPTSSPAWQDTVVTTPTTIHYSGVSTSTPLVDGASDTLVYTMLITVPIGYIGSVSYSVTSTPTVGSGGGIPEPASLALLALGGVGLVMRRRGR